MADASDLCFRVERSPFDSLVEPEVGSDSSSAKSSSCPTPPRVFSAG